MHSPSASPHQIVGAITNTLRGFQQRRDQRRFYASDGFAGPEAAAAPTMSPPRSPVNPAERAEDMSPFRPCGFVEIDGRAVPVMDPVFLQALQAQMAQGMVPPPFFNTDMMEPRARAPESTTTDPQASAAVHGATNPEYRPASPPPAAAANSGEHAPSKPEEVAGKSDEPRASAAPDLFAAQMERLLDRRADEEAARLGALLREHEQRLAEQAEALARQQAALLREVLDVHRTQQAEQANRHAQVVRDLLREHQTQLDDQATAAVTREAQAIGTLLREHREALVDAQEAHRRGLEELLASHRDELQAARGPRSGDDKYRDALTEQAKLQHAAQLQLASGIAALHAVAERLGEAVHALAEQAAKQRADLSWLPPPPSFVPPLPVVPTTSAIPKSQSTAQTIVPPPSAAAEATASTRLASAKDAMVDHDSSPSIPEPASAPIRGVPAAAWKLARVRVHELMDVVHLEDPDDNATSERNPERCHPLTT